MTTQLDEDVIESLEKALDDIKEWFTDQGADAILENLSPGCTMNHLVQVAGTHGLVIHEDLMWLYTRHNGQPQLERFPLIEWCTFLSVERACADAYESMLSRYFGVERGHGGVDREYVKDVVFASDELEPGELDTQWFPFANQEGDFYAVHATSGRVARFLKGDYPAGVIVAPSLSDFLCDYADALWRDEYVISGDQSLDFVTTDGHHYLGAYAGRVEKREKGRKKKMKR